MTRWSREPLAFPLVTSGHGVKAAAFPAGYDLGVAAAEPCATAEDCPGRWKCVFGVLGRDGRSVRPGWSVEGSGGRDRGDVAGALRSAVPG